MKNCKYGPLKKGVIRSDGMMFWQYYANGYEYWVTKEAFERMRLAKNLEAKNRRDTDEWRKQNAEYCAKYYAVNIDKIRPIARQRANAFYHKNKVSVLEKQKRRYYDPIVHEKALQQMRAYNSSPKGRISLAIKGAKRRAIEKQVPISDTFEVSFLYHLCSAFNKGGTKHHVDHIIPISKGGTHSAANLRVIPAIVNLRKGAKLLAA